MVWESYYWKQRLRVLILEIEAISEEDEASPLDISNLEIAIFTGFFLVRKLVEAQTKLSSKVENQNIRCQTALKKNNTPLVDIMNRFDVGDLYDLETLQASGISLKKACNIFIHSVFLWMSYDESGIVAGVLVTSSYEKDKTVYLIGIPEIIGVFRSVSRDDLSDLQMYRDAETNEMKVRKA